MELYPELIDYIFEHCGKFKTDRERLAYKHHIGELKYDNSNNNPIWDKFFKEKFFTEDQEALDLLKDGYQAFVINTATRIFNEHKDNLNLNLCPKCGKIARTPKAKQCRFCGFDWH